LFHIYRWGLNKRGSNGYYIYGSLRVLSQLENLRRRKYKIRGGQRVHGIIVRARKELLRLDGSKIGLWDNSVITFRRGFKPRGIKFWGPTTFESGRLKIWTFFKAVI
jgi:ribosomal protein L14